MMWRAIAETLWFATHAIARCDMRLTQPIRNLGELFTILVFLAAGSALATQQQLVSGPIPSHVAPAGGNGDSVAPILSADGRFVLFASTANNLVVNSNGIPAPSLVPARFNVYLRDRSLQTSALVSINTNGVSGGNGDSFPVAISTNGQFVLF